jgi:N,N'-diacetyllegionaminate synthase
MKNKIIVIAEAGVNHNGSLRNAFKLIDKAEEAGADYIKFQTFEAEKLVTSDLSLAEYQKNDSLNLKSQFQLLKNLELTKADHHELISYCGERNISFLSSAFDMESLKFLIYNLDLDLIKIPSGEITNLPYLRVVGSQSKPIIMSTGMSTVQEISDAIKVLLSMGTKKSNITLLHCNTAYPTPMEDVNLKAISFLKKQFDIKVGFSDHTIGIEAPIAAVAIGASIIEKHFTLDKSMVGPDHAASLEPDELKKMITAIRNITIALGKNEKNITQSEKININKARKSIVANNNLSRNQILTENNMTTKRAGDGVSPMKWDLFIGKKINRDIYKNEIISESDIY